MRNVTAVAVSALCTVGFAGIAAADGMDINLTFDSVDRGRLVDINYQAGDNWDAAARTSGWAGGYAGRLVFNNGSFKAFCAEIDVEISSGDSAMYKRTEVEYIPSPDPMGATKANVMRSHFAQNFGTLSSHESYAAFAIVLWEIAQEGWDGTDLNELNFAEGAVQIDATRPEILTMATDMIGRLADGGSISLYGWTNPAYQDLITVVPGPSIALAGVIGLAGIRRRRRN